MQTPHMLWQNKFKQTVLVNNLVWTQKKPWNLNNLVYLFSFSFFYILLPFLLSIIFYTSTGGVYIYSKAKRVIHI